MSEPRHYPLWRLGLEVISAAVGLWMLVHETLGQGRLGVMMVALLLLSGPAVIRVVVEGWFRKS